MFWVGPTDFASIASTPLNIFLEHYFEMSHVDAEQALAIYRHFCKQTEHVVEYLAVAKKLQNLLNVPIPNLKHVSDLRCSLIDPCCLN